LRSDRSNLYVPISRYIITTLTGAITIHPQLSTWVAARAMTPTELRKIPPPSRS
jgi:hypothetical protein